MVRPSQAAQGTGRGVMESPRRFLLLATIVAVSSACVACAESKPEPAPSTPVLPAATQASPVPPPAPASVQRVDPQRAMRYVREVVGFGSRPPGSRGHRRLEAYLRAHLKNDHLEEDAFTASTPAGDLPMRNFIAKYPGTKDGVIVIASHYDTNLPLKNFVGANDSGSSTGLLLELAHHLRGKKRDGYSVWLVWFDGEEAIREWSPTDSLYGSRHLAGRWQKDGTLRKIKAFVLLDMIGDKQLSIARDQNSTPWLLDLVGRAAARLNYEAHFFQRGTAIEDDHMPFARAGVPVVDLIDFEYGYGNVFHHTSEDTLDKLSPRSLEVVGNVVLETVRLLDAK
ncbi:MAG: M28 family peptidase [Terriglobales bacterium]